jgi:UDPglucose 6-dehydrogenase
MAREIGAPSRLVEAVIAANDARKAALCSKIVAVFGPLQGQTLAIWGVAFKHDTDDVRDSPALVLLPALHAAGVRIRVYDPEAMPNARRALPPAVVDATTWCNSAQEAATNADGVVVMTEWAVFAHADFAALQRVLRRPLVYDMRRILPRIAVEAAGIRLITVGQV